MQPTTTRLKDITLLLVFAASILVILVSLVRAIGAKADSVCYQIASEQVYRANHCEEVTGVVR